ncbi:MAG: xanthine dehydrogenase family protein subunit M [Hyphomicrobiales bacterium]|nr:MAG: xanthine dehydrogenase family protein subunit M [Hyphomicrobiales bacterium]
MKAPRFSYVRPASLTEALNLLAEKGPEARLLAGGQSLLAALAFRLSDPQVLIDISKLPELTGVTRVGDKIRIGAGTTHSALGRDALIASAVPLIAQAIPHIAHPAIRNRGTIGGSLAYADPAAELPACVVALEADLVARSKTGERRIKAADFFTGLFSTALEPGEILTALEVPVASASDRCALVEVARRSGDYAMAGVALKATLAGDRIIAIRPVFFGLGDAPVLAHGAAQALTGGPPTGERIAAAKAALATDLDPPGDQHGGPEMKRHLAGVVLERAIARMTNSEARAA